MERASKGRGLFYTRDSGGRHETTPAEYVDWARRRAEGLGVTFEGTREMIEQMIRDSLSVSGDLFLDFGVCGNVMSRAGLDALIHEALADANVSHVFAPRRDRIARPDDPLVGVQLENVLRAAGITLVFMDRVVQPIQRGKRGDVAELIVALLDYDRSGRDRRDLAEKILFAQLNLASLGFSTGGRPPFGFRRWLAKDDGTHVRQLEGGERVRMAGHHVVWLPSNDEAEWKLIGRILEMIRVMPAYRVARTLNNEGIPSPDAGRSRTDNGIQHEVSGQWHPNTVTNVARNPLLRAVTEYGRRSMGDQARFTPEGPRDLTDEDYRGDQKPKIRRNEPDQLIVSEGKFDPIVDPDEHQQLIATLNRRGKSQRGKPRSRDPNRNPLGARIFDMNCGWPMYREPYKDSFRYKCGLYSQSHGGRCSHNHILGEVATKCVLGCVSQRMLLPTMLPQLEVALRKIANREGHRDDGVSANLEELRQSIKQTDRDIDRVSQNMALAESSEQFKAMSKVFDDLRQRRVRLEKEMEEVELTISPVGSMEDEIEKALNLLQDLTELVSTDDLASAREVFELTNARLFLRFAPLKKTKRTVNTVKSVVVTLGTALPPIKIYHGPTSRNRVKQSAASSAAEPEGATEGDPPVCVISDEKGKSLGNVNRGDWI